MYEVILNEVLLFQGIRMDPKNKKAVIRFAEHQAAVKFVGHYQRRPMVDLSLIKVTLIRE